MTGEEAATATEKATVDKTTFETVIPLDQEAAYIAVEALDDDGTVLATGIARQ